MALFVTFIIALAVTMALIPPLAALGRRYAVVDLPGERKVHTLPVPRVGGVAMVLGAVAALAIWGSVHWALRGLLPGLAVLLLFGVWDDVCELGYRLKFAGQFAAAAIVVVLGGVKISVYPFLGLTPLPDAVAIPVTIVVLVGVTNAINLSDGLDGLAAGISLLSLAGIALLGYSAGGTDLVVTCAAVGGAIFGFLRFNTYPAKVFMGDTGSQFLGFAVGVLAIQLTQHTNTALNPALPLLLVGIPIIDTAYVMLRRIRAGRSPFSPDQGHVHHRLLAGGLAHYEAVAVIYLAQIALVSAAVLLRYDSDGVVVGAYLALAAGFLLVVLMVGRLLHGARHTPLTGWVGAVDRSPWSRRIPGAVITCGMPLYLLVGALAVPGVPRDIELSAAGVLVVLVLRLLAGDRMRFVPLRLLLFPAIAFAVYVIHIGGVYGAGTTHAVQIGVLSLIGVAMYFSIRYTQDVTFRTTPTDLLVIAVAVGIGILYEEGMIDVSLAPMVVELILLFYCGEIGMRRMRGRWNCLTVGMLVVLAVLARGLI